MLDTGKGLLMFLQHARTIKLVFDHVRHLAGLTGDWGRGTCKTPYRLPYMRPLAPNIPFRLHDCRPRDATYQEAAVSD